jgi:hypothetical protein
MIIEYDNYFVGRYWQVPGSDSWYVGGFSCADNGPETVQDLLDFVWFWVACPVAYAF